MKIVTDSNLYRMWAKIKLQITAITDPIKQRLSAVEQALQNGGGGGATNPLLIHCLNNPVYYYAPTPNEDESPFILPPDCDISDHIGISNGAGGVVNDLNITALGECLDVNPTWALPANYPQTNFLTAQDLAGAQVCSLYLRQAKMVASEEEDTPDDMVVISYAFVGVVWKNTATDNLMMRLINMQETKFSSRQLVGDVPKPIGGVASAC